MERVTFLLEDGAQRVSCLLNPERLVVTRTAGVTARRSLGGLLSGQAQSDDPLLPSGGGVTELELELLFDTSLDESPARAEDVRDLTRPLWRLAEGGGSGELARVRFLWGKAWNVPGVVLAVSELFEAFGVGGAPQRSWLRMRLRRVAEPPRPADPAVTPGVLPAPGPLSSGLAAGLSAGVTFAAPTLVHEVIGGPDGGDRIDTLAWRYYGSAALWRLVAAAGAITHPLQLQAGLLLHLPAPAGEGAPPADRSGSAPGGQP